MKKVSLFTICFFISIFYLAAQAKENSSPRDVVFEEPEAEEKKDGKIIYHVVEQMPAFPGGNEKLQEYLSKNLKYPITAKKAGIEGVVYLGFLITETGKIEDIVIHKGVSKECDEEAVRVVKNMPKWTPGKQSGKNVIVRYTQPIKFKL